MGRIATDKINKELASIIEKNNPKIFRKTLNKKSHRYTTSVPEMSDEIKYQISRIRKYSSLSDTELNEKIRSISQEFIDEIRKELKTKGAFTVQHNSTSGTSINCIVTSDNKDNFSFIGKARVAAIKSSVVPGLVNDIFGSYKTDKDYKLYNSLSAEDTAILNSNSKALREYDRGYEKRREKAIAAGRTEPKYNPPTLKGRGRGGLSTIKGNASLTGLKDRRDFTTGIGAKYDQLSYYIEGSLDNPGKTKARSGSFQQGHDKSMPSSKKAVEHIANQLSNYMFATNLGSPSIEVKAELQSAFKGSLQKFNLTKEIIFGVEIEVFTTEESGLRNISSSQRESQDFQKELADLQRLVTETLKNIDWPNQENSSTYKQVLIAGIKREAIRSFTKKNKKIRVRSSTKDNLDLSASSSTIQNKQKRSKVVKESRGKLGIPISLLDNAKKGASNKRNQVDKPRTENWSSLLPMINAKLTPRVIANMRYPSLVNRTGTFANSAKVINIEQTREGFPTFVFDYERDPYNVFDRTQGRAPWNTPERDPRALVDKSVREIVREMAIGRFYTRRA